MIQHITDTERALQSRVNKLEAELERLRAAEPVAEVHRRHLLASDQNDGHWCREVLLYSGNSPHDWLDGKNTRVKLYRAAPPAHRLSEARMDGIYKAWRDMGDDVSYGDLMRMVEAEIQGGK